MTLEEYNRSVDLYSDGIYRFVLKVLRDSEKAKDIVQDAYERLWVKHLEISNEKVKSYLFTTAYHKAIDEIRTISRKMNYESVAGKELTTSAQLFDVKAIIDEAIEQLSDIQKSVLLLRDYEGYSYDEIGEITDLNESQVKVYIYRARLFLKNYLVSIENLI